MLFRWGCPLFQFFVYNIRLTSYPTLTYSNICLFVTTSFHFLLYNINVNFSPTLTYFKLFHVTTTSFYYLMYHLNITFSPTLTNSNIFLFTTAWFTPLWYVIIKFWNGSVTCCLTCLGFIIYKTGFFGQGLDLHSSLLFLTYFSVQLFNLRYTLISMLFFHDRINLNIYFTKI